MLAIREHVPLAPLTTFQIGGPARWFVEVSNLEGLQEAVEYARSRNISFRILSGGSNVLVPDEGLNKLVIRIVEGEYVFFEQGLRADAGCNLMNLIQKAAERNFGGWEKLAGIPGTIGGAVRGNAGAFGSEIKDFVTTVSVFNTEAMRQQVFEHPHMQFSYRDSTFKRQSELVITSVAVELSFDPHGHGKQLIEETVAERERRHLQNVAAAGSFFMNPTAPQEIVELFEKEKNVKSKEGRVPAGWLIEKAGLKGFQIGGAVASQQHPNYLVNAGGASAQDVLALAAKIKDEVQKQFGVELHEEAAIL